MDPMSRKAATRTLMTLTAIEIDFSLKRPIWSVPFLGSSFYSSTVRYALIATRGAGVPLRASAGEESETGNLGRVTS